MDQFHVEADGTTKATPETVWALLADAERWSDWGPWSASGYESPGDQAAGGVGAVRWLRYRRTKLREQVLEVEPGKSMAYTVLQGMPVRNYRGEVTLNPIERGTHIHWSATWDRTVGGKVALGLLRSAFPDIVAKLAAAADRAA